MLAGYLGTDLGAAGSITPETPTLQHLSENPEHAAGEVAAGSQFYFGWDFLSFALITRTPHLHDYILKRSQFLSDYPLNCCQVLLFPCESFKMC